jgi:hypothetical protein
VTAEFTVTVTVVALGLDPGFLPPQPKTNAAAHANASHTTHFDLSAFDVIVTCIPDFERSRTAFNSVQGHGPVCLRR